MQNFCFASLNMQNLWRCRCRRVVDLKLSNVSGEDDNESSDVDNVDDNEDADWEEGDE